MDAYTGEIRAFPFGFAPPDWLLCNGAEVSVQQYHALASVIGHTFDLDSPGNVFRLPNLTGRAIVGAVDFHVSPNEYSYEIGYGGGQSKVALAESELPTHTHNWVGARVPGHTSDPNNALLGNIPGIAEFSPANEADFIDATMGSTTIGLTGGNNQRVTQEHENMQPFLTIAFYICAEGIYPVPE